MAETQIEWTDATWNPVAGCTIVSAGCTNCYAMEMARRLQAMNVAKYKGLTRRSGNRTIWNGVVREHDPGGRYSAHEEATQLSEVFRGTNQVEKIIFLV
jgi:protein gp37